MLNLVTDEDKSLSLMSLSELLAWENRMFYLNQTLSYPLYLKEVTQYLRQVLAEDKFSFLEACLKQRPRKIAVYPGSFDPFHKGHLSILLKAEALFDKVVIAVGINPQKMASEADFRVQNLKEILKDREVLGYQGYLTDFLATLQYETTIIRGLRNGYDLEYELNQLRFIEDMSQKDINLCFIPCDREYSYLSSTALRNMQKIAGEKEKLYLPKSFRDKGIREKIS